MHDENIRIWPMDHVSLQLKGNPLNFPTTKYFFQKNSQTRPFTITRVATTVICIMYNTGKKVIS